MKYVLCLLDYHTINLDQAEDELFIENENSYETHNEPQRLPLTYS